MSFQASHTPQLFLDDQAYCPLCIRHFQESDYLKEVIDDERVLWLANMITHYRHEHITWWNKCWSRTGKSYRSGWFGDYETEKRKVNERIKRQLVRKLASYMRYHGITSTHFSQLMNNDRKTLELAGSILNSEHQLSLSL